MDRDLHKKYIPISPPVIPLVDMYTWQETDRTERVFENGTSRPIYNVNGHLLFTLPLEDYPPVDAIHPQIAYSFRPMFEARNPEYQTPSYQKSLLPVRVPDIYRVGNRWMQRDKAEGRVEGIYL